MIYLVGGAPRTGKSILAQEFAAEQNIGWISTDLLMEMLRVKGVEGIKSVWDATPEGITQSADWFFPCLERFVAGVSYLSENYLIEGVDFLPAHVAQLSECFNIQPLFLGCSNMTLDRFDRYPGRSPGYARLPEEMRRQFVRDVPRWSEFIRGEASRFDLPYLDMTGDFQARMSEATAMLKGAKG